MTFKRLNYDTPRGQAGRPNFRIAGFTPMTSFRGPILLRMRRDFAAGWAEGRFHWIRPILLLAALASAAWLIHSWPITWNSAVAPAPQQLWSIDLSLDPDFRKRIERDEVLLAPPSLAFLNQAQIICSYYSRGLLVEGEGAGNGYHVLEISSRDGTRGTKLTFDALEDGYRSLPVADGGFVVLAGDKLTKYTNQFKLSAVVPTPRVMAGETYDRWYIGVSPTGKTVLLYSRRVGQDGEWKWLDSTTLSTVAAVSSPGTAPGSDIEASDDAAIRRKDLGRVLFNARGERAICSRCDAYFVDDRTFLIDKDSRYFIETENGNEILNGKLDVGVSDFARSAAAPEIAFATGHYLYHGLPVIAQHWYAVTGTVIVLDWKTKEVVTQLSWKEPIGNPSAGLRQMALALSPDGTRLAILLHHTLTLYLIPSRG